MKAEVEAVQMRHMQIRVAEEEHLKSRHLDQNRIVNAFFDEENARVRELGKAASETAAARLAREQQLEHNEQAITSVFGGADAMRLLLLSELLGADSLVDSCTKVLAQNRPPTDWLPDDTMGESESFKDVKRSNEKTAEMKIQGVQEKQPD